MLPGWGKTGGGYECWSGSTLNRIGALPRGPFGSGSGIALGVALRLSSALLERVFLGPVRAESNWAGREIGALKSRAAEDERLCHWALMCSDATYKINVACGILFTISFPQIVSDEPRNSGTENY